MTVAPITHWLAMTDDMRVAVQERLTAPTDDSGNA